MPKSNSKKRKLPVLTGMAKYAKYRQADESAPPVDWASYDVVACGHSGGKDSVVQTEQVFAELEALGLTHRMVVYHASLGSAEWAGTMELARDHAAALGVRFEVVSRIGGKSRGDCRNEYGVKLYEKGEAYGDLLEQVVRRWRQLSRLHELDPERWPSTVPWMSRAARWCTSDFKTNPSGSLFTQLADEWHAANPGQGRPCRILDCLGLRAQESGERAKKPQLRKRTRSRRQHVDTYLPVKWWTEEQIWERITRPGAELPYHPAYDMGMPRLSCVFCAFAGKDALMIAGEWNPELLDRYIEVEDLTGHSFKPDLSLRSIRDALQRGERAASAQDWAA